MQDLRRSELYNIFTMDSLYSKKAVCKVMIKCIVLFYRVINTDINFIDKRCRNKYLLNK